MTTVRASLPPVAMGLAVDIATLRSRERQPQTGRTAPPLLPDPVGGVQGVIADGGKPPRPARAGGGFGGGEAVGLAFDERRRVAEPVQHLRHRARVLAAAHLGLDPGAQPPGEVQPLLGAQHAVGRVGGPGDVVQHELIGTLSHV
ncbi:hypothetical protein GCM10009734_52630 [Nonomuraea bangladeshensis]